MSSSDITPRRIHVEANLYRRPDGTYEAGWRDAGGVQRWRTVQGDLGAARALRGEVLERRAEGAPEGHVKTVRFGTAAERWLLGPVSGLRPSTRANYTNSIDRHLLPRFSNRRLDAISADDVAKLIRELREEGMAEGSISQIVAALRRTYRYAARRLGWSGQDPAGLLMRSERPKPSEGRRRPIFEGDQLSQVITAALPRYRPLLILAALTGARVSELCGLRWADVELDDLDDATVEFAFQVDGKGERRPTKNFGSARTVPIPREVAVLLARHRSGALHTAPESPVFATSPGRPISQRNVSRALRAAMRRAVEEDGRPAFPALHERMSDGRPRVVARGELPSMHSFRHTVASRALLAGESVDEIAILLGHKDATVTRQVYVREVADARRRLMRRSRMLEEYRDELEAAGVADEH
jgi:integrase